MRQRRGGSRGNLRQCRGASCLRTKQQRLTQPCELRLALQEETGDKSMRIWPTRWWKRIGLGFVILVALALLANGVMAWRTSARLNGKIAAIRATGEPASI